MAAKRTSPAVGRRAKVLKYTCPSNQDYRLVERTSGEDTAYIIQRSPKTGVWFDLEGYDSELLARKRFADVVNGGVEDRIIDRKIKHTRAAKVLAQGETTKEESET